MVDYSYKITYEKEQDYWKLIEHGMTKDTSHRSYGLNQGTGDMQYLFTVANYSQCFSASVVIILCHLHSRLYGLNHGTGVSNTFACNITGSAMVR